MGRSYKKKLGVKFMNYSDDNIQKAIADILSGRKSYREAAECYRIPKSTLNDKITHKHIKLQGGQPILSKNDEKLLANGIKLFSEWGFPMTRADIRGVVKNYLDRKGLNVKRFKENLPGLDWFYNFLKRNKILTERFAQNIKRCRANVTKKDVKDYFSNLEKILENVPPCNIVNYDETNITDDPGKIKVICRRGSKRVDRIIDSNKSSISVMMAISGSGVMLPPYTVYKAVHLYPTWIEGGIEGAVYNRTKSGWFDAPTFENWFEKIALPYFKSLDGKKILIGDNLASHVSIYVLECCQANNIEFVLLPPNATHLLQPLDVAFFAPMKKSWRTVLTEWKQKNKGCLPKSEFPRLFKKAVEKIGAALEANIKSGFRACGIVPFNPNHVLSKLPDTTPEEPAEEDWTNTLKEFLMESRIASSQSSTSSKQRGKKLSVPPGKGISVGDLRKEHRQTFNDEETMEEEQSTTSATESSLSDVESISESINNENKKVTEEIYQAVDENERESGDVDDIASGTYLLIKLSSIKNRCKLYVGCVTEIIDKTEHMYLVNFLRKVSSEKMGDYFTYPLIKDESIVERHQIVKVLKSFTALRRNRLQFPSLRHYCDKIG